MYRSEVIEIPFTRAHNTYLENALELGIPAAAMLVLALMWILLICFTALRHYGRRANIPCMGLAITALIGTHSLVDYTMTVPAIAATYACWASPVRRRCAWRARTRSPKSAATSEFPSTAFRLASGTPRDVILARDWESIRWECGT